MITLNVMLKLIYQIFMYFNAILSCCIFKLHLQLHVYVVYQLPILLFNLFGLTVESCKKILISE